MNKQPFFARYLESQRVRTGIRAGASSPVTLKYPSDDDEMNYITMRYPSDDDQVEGVFPRR